MSKKYKNKTNKQIDKNDQIIHIIDPKEYIIKDMTEKEELLYKVIDSLENRIQTIEIIFEKMYHCIDEMLIDQQNPPIVSIMKTFRKVKIILSPHDK